MQPEPDFHESSAASPAAMPLSRLREGERARLHIANLCCEDCDLLHAMGLTDQCEIRVCQRGEPCIVQVNATRLGISGSLARNIMVLRDADGS